MEDPGGGRRALQQISLTVTVMVTRACQISKECSRVRLGEFKPSSNSQLHSIATFINLDVGSKFTPTVINVVF